MAARSDTLFRGFGEAIPRMRKLFRGTMIALAVLALAVEPAVGQAPAYKAPRTAGAGRPSTR